MSYTIAEYRCPHHGVFEELTSRPAPDAMSCPSEYCTEVSPWCMSAPKPKVVSMPCFATVRGGDMADRPKGMLDTRDLGEGKITHSQWKEKQRDAQRERRHQQLIKAGITSRKIQVG